MRQPGYPRERLTVPPRMVESDSATARADRVGEGPGAQVSRRSHETPRLWSLPLPLPRPSRITSAYGGAREYNGQVTSRQLGTDFAGAVGHTGAWRPARAWWHWWPTSIWRAQAVYLDHGAGLVTGYFHLSRADVTAGDTVRRASGSARWAGAGG